MRVYRCSAENGEKSVGVLIVVVLLVRDPDPMPRWPETAWGAVFFLFNADERADDVAATDAQAPSPMVLVREREAGSVAGINNRRRRAVRIVRQPAEGQGMTAGTRCCGARRLLKVGTPSAASVKPRSVASFTAYWGSAPATGCGAM
jgi:hypothetical protein